MTDPFQDFISSDIFKLDDLTKVSCSLVHPFVKKAMGDYYMERPVTEMISNLQFQIASCTATEFMEQLSREVDETELEGSDIPFLPFTGERLSGLIKNAIAVAFSTYNDAINGDIFDDDETANPCH